MVIASIVIGARHPGPTATQAGEKIRLVEVNPFGVVAAESTVVALGGWGLSGIRSAMHRHATQDHCEPQVP